MHLEAETSRPRGDKTSPHNPSPGTKTNILCLSSLPCAMPSSSQEASVSSKQFLPVTTHIFDHSYSCRSHRVPAPSTEPCRHRTGGHSTAGLPYPPCYRAQRFGHCKAIGNPRGNEPGWKTWLVHALWIGWMGQMKNPRLALSPEKTDRKNNFKKCIG